MAKHKAPKGETSPVTLNAIAQEVSAIIDHATDGAFIVTFSRDGSLNFRAVNCGLERIAMAQAIAAKCAHDRLSAASEAPARQEVM